MSSESDGLPRLVLHIQPGLVSAFYFLLFDLVLLTFVDVLLARAASFGYYSAIYKGHTVTLKSVDIPGVTTFLVGRLCSPINAATLVVKLAFLAAILSIDIAIDAETVRPEESITLGARLGMNLTDAYWEKENYVGLTFLWDSSRGCRVRSDEDDSIVFYTVAFNVTGNTSADDFATDGSYVPPDSLFCLKPDRVSQLSVRPLSVVNGCSPNRQTSCTEPTVELWRERNTRRPDFYDIICFDFGAVITSNCVYVVVRAYYGFDGISEYGAGSLFCVYSRIGDFSSYENDDSVGRVDDFQTCLFTTKVENGYLVENWTYNSSTFTRRYPGPVFDKDPQLGVWQTVAIAPYLLKGNMDYETLSSIVVANGAVLEFEEQNVQLFQGRKTVTIVPFYALILIAIIILVTTIAYVVSAFTVAKDIRPQINAINGLSSIAREENHPSGRSLTAGHGIAIGLILRYPNAARLVPVRKGTATVSRSEVNEIV